MLDYLPYLWLAVIIFMTVCELATAQMISIWFVLGGVAALITSFFTDSFIIQAVVFSVVTALSLILTRPLVKKLKITKITHTNSDRYIGKTGKVTMEIDNTKGKGQVNIGGSIWSAKSSGDETIPVGADVTVERIEGVRLIVNKN